MRTSGTESRQPRSPSDVRLSAPINRSNSAPINRSNKVQPLKHGQTPSYPPRRWPPPVRRPRSTAGRTAGNGKRQKKPRSPTESSGRARNADRWRCRAAMSAVGGLQSAYFCLGLAAVFLALAACCRSTASVLSKLATFFDSALASNPLGSQPSAIDWMRPPFSIKKLVGIRLV